MRQTRMSGAMRGSQETKVMPKGPSLRACSLLYIMMASAKSLFLQELRSHYKMAPDTYSMRRTLNGF